MNSASTPSPKPVRILLVEDDEGDILLTKKALNAGTISNSLQVVRDGVEALEFLRNEGEYSEAKRPDLVLLDLNMPRMDGRETLAQIKKDEKLRSIPVVVLTTSDAEHDVMQSYDLQASCYITKPVDFEQFSGIFRALNDFWFSVVKLPPQ